MDGVGGGGGGGAGGLGGGRGAVTRSLAGTKRLMVEEASPAVCAPVTHTGVLPGRLPFTRHPGSLGKATRR